MSTLEGAAAAGAWARPSPSTPLVPPAGDRGPRLAAVTDGGPRHGHRYFFGLWYAGVALLPLGAFAGPRHGDAMLGLTAAGVVMVSVGGLGVLVHVLYRPRMRKLRAGLGAVGALVLGIALAGPIGDAAREVYAASRAAALQPLADDLAGDGRIRRIGVPNPGWVELNGFRGRLDGTALDVRAGATTPLAKVLRDDGVSRLELVRLIRRLREAGVRRVEVNAAYVAIESDAPDLNLLYVRPGHALPPPRRYRHESSWERTQPLGGGWYLLLGRTRRD